jgi:RNA polymerase-binding transcription factor DksA
LFTSPQSQTRFEIYYRLPVLFGQGKNTRPEREGRESILIRKIKNALTRLEDGSFGICDECGEEIPEERLKARPVATLCIKCKEPQEDEEKLRGL